MNILIPFWLSISSSFYDVLTMSCGIDNSPISHVYEGLARIETYPWLGILYYPYNNKRFTTAVVLVTRQIVLGAATEIDRLPKADFRARARVVIGYNCSGPHIGVRDYTYHPDFTRDTYSALAMIQLETDHVRLELRPICPPPSHFKDQSFYAMVLSDNCRRSKVRIHKMKYVSTDQCKNYYRRTGLGFGVYGPGCQAPARFLDYGMYHAWVQRSIERIGRPAISNLGPNHVILRRSLSNVQRFGPCDPEETKRELYTDHTRMMKASGKLIYNVTIISDVEYSCVIFRADYENPSTEDKPKLRLRRWCAGSTETSSCSGFGFLEIQFYVEIKFDELLNFHVKAYGKQAKTMVATSAIEYINRVKYEYPVIELYEVTKMQFRPMLYNKTFPWYEKNQ